DPPVSPERPLPDPLQEQVEANRERAHDALAQSVVGDVPQAELLTSGDVKTFDARSVETDLARGQRPLSRDHLGQRTLSVPVHPCDTDDLALGELQRDVLEARIEPPDGPRRYTRERQQRAGVRGLLVHGRLLALA